MRAFHQLLQSTFIALAVLLAGCGGGSGGGSVASGGIGGTGQIASGTITAFGSIFVNGIEFKNIGTATCTIDGTSVLGSNCQSSLQLGMVVKVNGTFDSTTGAGTATQVVYNNDVDGPVSNILPTTANLGPADVTRTFTVLNTKVQIDSASTKFISTTGTKGFSNLADADVVEVSGFFDSNGLLHATYIEVKPTFSNTTKVEIKGSVSITNPVGGASAAGDSFVVTGTNNIPINVVIANSSQVPGGADLSDMPGGVVQNNTLVEVRGTYDSATKTITADRVQPDDTSIGGDGDEVNIEGLVTDFVSQSNFKVAGQQVDATSAIFSPLTLMSQLANGIKVEVEGNISGTTLNATKVESRGNDIKIEARVSKNPVGNTVTVQFASGGTLVILVDNQTQMEDKFGPAPIQKFHLPDITKDDFLEIRGFINTDTMIDVTASQIRRTTLDDDVLEGPLDSASGVSNSVSILGVNFTTDPVNTDFSGSGVSDSTTFYNNAQGGCIVKVEDGDVPTTYPNGIADEISLEGSCP